MAEKGIKQESKSEKEGNKDLLDDRTDNGLKKEVDDDDKSNSSASQSECVVCLQSYHHPVQLPCGHIFCFLCVKGVAARSQRCALCRADVPPNYFDQPVVVHVDSQQPPQMAVNKPEQQNDTTTICKWFYEGRNGWWQYEDRACIQLEEAFIKGEQSTELVVAGFVYIAEIGDMVQYRKNYPTRRRRIKRDKATADKKGVAGLKSNAQRPVPDSEAAILSETDVDKADTRLAQNRDIRQPESQVDSLGEQLKKTM